MLQAMQYLVQKCVLCELGRRRCIEHDTNFDPHVFSTMSISKFFICGQNPGFHECLKGEPFVGDAGEFFNEIIQKFNLSRKDFYISNSVKCHTSNNVQPNFEQISCCEFILHMEILLLRPKLVITLGAVAFNAFCPNKNMADHLGNIIKSEKFGVSIYPIYHPSPRNMQDPVRKKRFIDDIKTLCELIQNINARKAPIDTDS
jgi:DNA polymerase